MLARITCLACFLLPAGAADRLPALAADAPPAGVDKGELKKLQGRWQLVAQEHGGKKAAAKELVRQTLEVAGERLTVRDGVDVKEESKIVRLASKGKPALVDLKITAGADLDKVVQGIYRLEGNTLTLCVAEPGKARPKELAGKEGTGHTLMVFKRLK